MRTSERCLKLLKAYLIEGTMRKEEFYEQANKLKDKQLYLKFKEDERESNN